MLTSCGWFGWDGMTYWSPVVGWLHDEDREGIVEYQCSEADVDAIAGDRPEDRGHEQVSERADSSHESLGLMVDSTPGPESLQEGAARRRRTESGLQVDLVLRRGDMPFFLGVGLAIEGFSLA